MDPITIKGAMQIASAAVSALGAIRQGQAQQQASEFQAQMYNREAQRELEIGQLNARRVAEENKRLAGSQRALLAQGRDLSSGSALLVQEDLGEEAEFNRLLALDAGETKSQSLRQQAVLERMKGRSAKTAGYMRGGTTLLKAGGTAFN